MKKFNNFMLLTISLIVIALCLVCIKPKPQVTKAFELPYDNEEGTYVCESDSSCGHAQSWD